MVGVKTERLQICIERKKEGGKKGTNYFHCSIVYVGDRWRKKKKLLQIFINAHCTFSTGPSDAKMGRLIVI